LDPNYALAHCGLAEHFMTLANFTVEMPAHEAMPFMREAARKAMEYFVSVADLLIRNGLPCPILSAAGTATWEITAANPRITEIQPGSYATMDGYHRTMEPRFKQAVSVLATVISRRPNWIVTDVGNKTVGESGAILKDLQEFRLESNIDLSRSDRPKT
jgi:D-serine deaminase-like pyridoxal phosphate-dependent protein